MKKFSNRIKYNKIWTYTGTPHKDYIQNHLNNYDENLHAYFVSIPQTTEDHNALMTGCGFFIWNINL